jgi:integrase
MLADMLARLLTDYAGDDPPAALEALAQLCPALMRGADWADNDLVFARFDGSPWRSSYVSRQFRVLAAQAGVPVIKLHETRHSAISLMADADVRDDIRMREAGHAGRSVHARYTHILDLAHRAAAEQVAALVRQAGSAR